MAAASRADTIVVDPVEIHLHVGQSLDAEQLKVTARNSSGEIVNEFAPVFVLASPIASFNGVEFRGRSVGAADLYVEALPSAPPSVRPRPRPSTRVRIVVEP